MNTTCANEIVIRNKRNGVTIWSGQAYDMAHAIAQARISGAYLRDAHLRDAYLRGADLTGADLRGAVLHGAVLTDADLTDIRHDFWAVLLHAIPEIDGLRQALDA